VDVGAAPGDVNAASAVVELLLEGVSVVAKLKPLTGMPKTVADAVITTVAVKASGSPCELRNAKV
jgi:hypothetical protein